MYNFPQLLADITKIQENRRTVAANLGITLQPYIIAVGPTISEVSDLFIAVDTTIYKVPSALEAIDLCFKIFHALDVEYPLESAHLWFLIQRVLYGYASNVDKMTPYVTETISDITTVGNINA